MSPVLIALAVLVAVVVGAVVGWLVFDTVAFRRARKRVPGA